MERAVILTALERIRLKKEAIFAATQARKPPYGGVDKRSSTECWVRCSINSRDIFRGGMGGAATSGLGHRKSEVSLAVDAAELISHVVMPWVCLGAFTFTVAGC